MPLTTSLQANLLKLGMVPNEAMRVEQKTHQLNQATPSRPATYGNRQKAEQVKARVHFRAIPVPVINSTKQ